MSSVIVNSTNELKELERPTYPRQPQFLRLSAKLISYIFHPIFIPVYILLFLLYIHPGVFAGFSDWNKKVILIQSLVPYVLLPVVTVLLLRGLNFISSIYLNTKKDRIIPFIACNLWYFWIWNVWKHLPDSPKEIVILSLAIFLASVAGMMANIYMKISMHAIAMGVLISFMVLLAFTQAVNMGVYLSISFFIAGLVCTARFIASDHNAKEIYGGLLLGILALIVANWL